MRISDWSSDVFSSDLRHRGRAVGAAALGNLVLVMREDQVLAAGMDVEDLAQVLRRHGGAFDVPAWPPPAPRAVPAGLVRIARSSDDRRVVTDCLSPCRSRWSPFPQQKKYRYRI